MLASLFAVFSVCAACEYPSQSLGPMPLSGLWAIFGRSLRRTLATGATKVILEPDEYPLALSGVRVYNINFMTTANNPDSQTIQTMFERLSGRYDLFNRLTSLGQDDCWRKAALESLREGMRVLDLGCGTGDLTLMAASRFPNHGTQVIGIDFSRQMLKRAQERLSSSPALKNADVKFLERRAEDLPMEREYYDLVVSGFVLRNIYEKVDWVLKGVYESLKSGGRISFLDFTEPSNAIQLALWRTYMTTVVAVYGKLLFGKDYPVSYMAESAKRFVKPEEFINKLEKTGFKDISLRKFMMGSIVLYQAGK